MCHRYKFHHFDGKVSHNNAYSGLICFKMYVHILLKKWHSKEVVNNYASTMELGINEAGSCQKVEFVVLHGLELGLRRT